MNFVGTGRRLAQGDVGDAARVLGIETAVLLAASEGKHYVTPLAAMSTGAGTITAVSIQATIEG